MKNVLLVLAVLAGFSVPLQAQTALPVEVICVRGASPGISYYKPICKHTKQAVNRNPLYRQKKNGNRYVVILNAQSGWPVNGDIVMSITMGARISDPLSQLFSYHVTTIPWVFSPSESSATGQLIVDEGLQVLVDFFSAVVNEINSYGASASQLDEATSEELQNKIQSEIQRVMRQQTN